MVYFVYIHFVVMRKRSCLTQHYESEVLSAIMRLFIGYSSALLFCLPSARTRLRLYYPVHLILRERRLPIWFFVVTRLLLSRDAYCLCLAMASHFERCLSILLLPDIIYALVQETPLLFGVHIHYPVTPFAMPEAHAIDAHAPRYVFVWLSVIIRCHCSYAFFPDVHLYVPHCPSCCCPRRVAAC